MSPVLRLVLASTVVLPAAAARLPSGWTLTPAVAASAGYDDNVFLQDNSPLNPLVADPAPADAGSGVFRASASLVASRKNGADNVFSIGYTAEFVRYEAFASENHDDHHLDLSLKGRSGDWSHAFKSSLLFVSGDHEGPSYGHAGGAPAIGGADVRARRDQTGLKVSGNLTRKLDGGWLRAITSVNHQDYHTAHAALPGYANYVDRAEYVAGLEGGRNVARDFALVAAVRTGVQRQADLLGVPQNSSNELLRLLVGVEGRVSPDLKISVLGGPDIRRYGPDVAAGFNRDQSARYLEASAVWTPTQADTVTLAGKDYLWLSSGGRTAYQNTNVNLAWNRVINADWSAALSANVEVGDNRDYVPAAPRFDWIYTATAAVTRRLDAKTTLELKLTREWSDTSRPGAAGHEYVRWLAGAGVTHTF
jgi:hypothetical protein